MSIQLQTSPQRIYNKYHIRDSLKFIEKLPVGMFKGIVTSPPYNKRFRNRGGNCSNWSNSKLMAANYTNYEDNMGNEDYIKWQRKFLELGVKAVGKDGVIMYNIGRRIEKLREDARTRILEGFPVRQTIIWNRGSSNNQGGKRPSIFPPIYEFVFVIAGDGWRLPTKHLSEMRKWGDVWRITFETGNPHPAPFPLALATRMVKCVDGPVLDPFAGSGTVGIAAKRLGLKYALCDLSPEYKKMFQDRLKNEHKNIYSLR